MKYISLIKFFTNMLFLIIAIETGRKYIHFFKKYIGTYNMHSKNIVSNFTLFAFKLSSGIQENLFFNWMMYFLFLKRPFFPSKEKNCFVSFQGIPFEFKKFGFSSFQKTSLTQYVSEENFFSQQWIRLYHWTACGKTK